MKKRKILVDMSATIIHNGHIRLLKKASKLGKVIVGLTKDKEISEINNKYRNKPYPTNIISFPTNEFQMLMTNNKKTKNHEIYFGDIVISMEKIILEASDEKKKVQDHFLHLMVHGILHLIGFEHCTERKAKKMEEVEKNIFNFVDIKNPYS